VWPNTSAEIIVYFNPLEAKTYQQTVFCDISGRDFLCVAKSGYQSRKYVSECVCVCEHTCLHVHTHLHAFRIGHCTISMEECCSQAICSLLSRTDKTLKCLAIVIVGEGNRKVTNLCFPLIFRAVRLLLVTNSHSVFVVVVVVVFAPFIAPGYYFFLFKFLSK
jgi:hypothetical protein